MTSFTVDLPVYFHIKFFRNILQLYRFQIFTKQSEITGKCLQSGIGSPPGLCSLNVTSLSSFGPPPGFSTVTHPETQPSSIDTVKSPDENVDVKVVKNGNKKKGKK